MKDNSNSDGKSQSATVGVIYKITNTINGKIYVGQTRQKLNKRISGHKHSQRKLGVDAAIRKYGWESFTVEIIETCPVEQLNEREIFWIAALNSKAPHGYNLTDGGDGVRGMSQSPETRKKISDKLKGRSTWNKGISPSDETRKKLSAARKRRSPPNKGKHHTPETKAKMSAAHKGYRHTAEARANMSVAQRAIAKKHKPLSPETKAKLSAKMKGRHPSPETLAKRSASMKAAWARRKKLENGGDK